MASDYRGRVRLLVFFMALCCGLSPAALAQTAQQKSVFTARDASVLLRQINDGLVVRQSGKVLQAFDLVKMRDGALFRQQITSFLSHTDSIRMHFNITNATIDGEKGTATVDAEMEADSGDGNTPPLHKQATLRFVAEHAGAGWKFTDVQPRNFFSTSSAPSHQSAPPQ